LGGLAYASLTAPGPTADEGPNEGGAPACGGGPSEPPDDPDDPDEPDCNEWCADQGYAKAGAQYEDVDGYVWTNDKYGNSPTAFYKCVEECEAGL
jgi:hypothetical protein